MLEVLEPGVILDRDGTLIDIVRVTRSTTIGMSWERDSAMGLIL